MHQERPRESFVRFLTGVAIIAILWAASLVIEFPNPWLGPVAWFGLAAISFFWLSKFGDTVGLLLDILSAILIISGILAFVTRSLGEDWRTYGIIAFAAGCVLGLMRISVRRKAAARPSSGVAGSARPSVAPAGRNTRTSRDCPQCGGRGQVACYSCHGRGVLPCPGCGGNGMVGFERCPRCGGAATVTCDYCSGASYLTCVLCHGSGKVL
jgi:hypothetical protein